MRRLSAFTFTLTITLTLSAAPPHVGLMREAAVAARAGEQTVVLAKLEKVAVLRPDYPRVHLNLARVYTAAGRTEDALAALLRLADMGVRVNAADAAYDPLREIPQFQELAPRLASGPEPVGTAGSTALTITGVTGIIESCLRDPDSGAWFFGDVRNRCIWKSGADGGALEKFTSDEDALDGVFRVSLSADHKTLWASTSAVGVMTGSDAEDGKRAALVSIDAATGRVRARFQTPDDGRKHLIGDFIVLGDGSILATDSLSPVIWRLDPGGTGLESWLEHEDFVNLQGIAFSADGSSLFVADYSNGIWRIDVASKAASLLTAPANASFFGIDGLQTVPGGLLAVQNGVNPQRVLLVKPSPAGPSPARIVACGLTSMTDLALGSRAGGRFHFVADSGWALFDPVPEKAPEPRDVTVVSVPVE